MRQVIIALLFAAGFACTAHAEEPAKQPDYYPLAVGNKWIFQAQIGADKVRMEVVVAKIEKVNGKPQATLEMRGLGPNKVLETLSADDKGVFLHRTLGSIVDPPETLMRYPLKDGDTWQETTKIDGDAVTFTNRVAAEEIEVPAGKYKAFRVEVTGELEDRKTESITWYAAGVGKIRQKTKLPRGWATVELEKFEPAK